MMTFLLFIMLLIVIITKKKFVEVAKDSFVRALIPN